MEERAEELVGELKKEELEKYGYGEGKVFLRMMTVEDTDLIVSWRNKDVVRKKFIYQALFTRESHLHWIETRIKTGDVVQMIICRQEDEKPVGSVYIRDIDRTHHKGEYGIFIGEDDARGKGYGSEAAKLMVRYGFEKLGLHRIFLRLLSDNIAALKSYENAGFQKEALLHDDVYLDGEYKDIILMGIIASNK